MFSEHRAPLSVVITSTRLRAKANENQFSERVTEIISTGAHFTDTTEENNSVTSEVTYVLKGLGGDIKTPPSDWDTLDTLKWVPSNL
ncbi:hypothetical protein EMCRGX_G027858 [Ephydatia muelleri]